MDTKPIAYITATIDEDWVMQGTEYYDTLPKHYRYQLERIIPAGMPIDFYVGAMHIAESSDVGARICYEISKTNSIEEFVRLINELVSKVTLGENDGKDYRRSFFSSDNPN